MKNKYHWVETAKTLKRSQLKLLENFGMDIFIITKIDPVVTDPTCCEYTISAVCAIDLSDEELNQFISKYPMHIGHFGKIDFCLPNDILILKNKSFK